MCNVENETYVFGSDVANANAHAICSFTLAVLGTVGNGLSIVLIVRGRLYTSGLAMMLLVDLCVTNMITTAFILPLIAVNSIHRDGWLYGDGFCAAFGFMMYVTLSTEVAIMSAITINQYLLVVHNFNTNNWLKTYRKLKLAIVLSLPWSTGFVYIAPLTRSWDAFEYEPKKGYCTLRNLSGTASIKVTVSFAYIVLIHAVVIFCYARIYWTHHKSRIRTNTTTLNLNSGNGTITTSSSRHSSRNQRATRAHQLLKMISLILVNFFITYIPFMIKAAMDPCLTRTHVGVTTAILYISWSHAATNPLIYALANRQIRAQWNRLLPCHGRRSMSLPSSDGGCEGVTKTKKEHTVAVLDNASLKSVDTKQ